MRHPPDKEEHEDRMRLRPLCGWNDEDVNEAPLQAGDLVENRFGKINRAAQSLVRAAVIDAAHDPFPVQGINDQEFFPERIIPGSAGHCLFAKGFAARGPFIDPFVAFAIPGRDPDPRSFGIQIWKP